MRYGDGCYSLATNGSDVDIISAVDLCGAQDSFLWWPETASEVAFVRNYFPSLTGSYYVGIDQILTGKGLYNSDGSFGVGIKYFTGNYYL